MKNANAIQWSVIAAVVVVALFVWFKPHRSDASTPEIPEIYSSNDVLVAIAPIEFTPQGRMRFSAARGVAMRAWEDVSGIVEQDGARAIKLTKAAHPNTIVRVAILDLHDERHQFSGYNIKTKSVEAHCSLRIEVLVPTTGAALFSKILTGEKSDTQTDAASQQTSESERQVDAVSTAIHKLDSDDDFKSAVLQSKTSTNAGQSTN